MSKVCSQPLKHSGVLIVGYGADRNVSSPNATWCGVGGCAYWTIKVPRHGLGWTWNRHSASNVQHVVLFASNQAALVLSACVAWLCRVPAPFTEQLDAPLGRAWLHPHGAGTQACRVQPCDVFLFCVETSLLQSEYPFREESRTCPNQPTAID